MAVKTIVQHPNKILNTKCSKVVNLSEGVQIANDLIDTLNASKIPGAGIAAPQIGINKRVFVARKFIKTKNGEKHKDIVLINPKFLNLSKGEVNSLEACLSIYDTYGFVKRHKSVKVEYTDLNGKTQTLKTGGFLSFVIQHEMDHLNGVLFIEKLVDGKKYSEKEIDKKLQNENN